MLDEYKTLLAELSGRIAPRTIQHVEFDSLSTLFCPSCQKFRPMHIKLMNRYSMLPQALLEYEEALLRYHEESTEFKNRGFVQKVFDGLFAQVAEPQEPQLSTIEPPALFLYTCQQCTLHFASLLYLANNAPVLVVLPSKIGGLATKNTPPDVAYYVNEGHKAACVNAVTSSVAMYRAAVDNLLKHQGYSGSLKQMVLCLEGDTKSGTGPSWSKYIDIELIDVLKELGDASMHASDMAKKKLYDRKLAAQSQLAITVILHAVYEKGVTDQELLQHLRSVVNKVTGP